MGFKKTFLIECFLKCFDERLKNISSITFISLAWKRLENLKIGLK